MQILKNPGDKLGCHISFEHRGEPISVWVGFALCEHPYTPIWVFSAFNRMDIPAHTEWTRVSTSPESTIPSDCPAAIYDGRVVVATSAPAGALPPEASWVLKKWDYNVVEVTGEPAPPPEKAEFRSLETGPYGNWQGEVVPTYTPVAPPVPPVPPVPPGPPPPPTKLVISNERLETWMAQVNPPPLPLTAIGAMLSFNTNRVALLRFRHREPGLTELGKPHRWWYMNGVWINGRFEAVRGTSLRGGILARRYAKTEFERDRSLYGDREIQPEAYDVETGETVYGKILGPFDFEAPEVLKVTFTSQKLVEVEPGKVVRLEFRTDTDCYASYEHRPPGLVWQPYEPVEGPARQFSFTMRYAALPIRPGEFRGRIEFRPVVFERKTALSRILARGNVFEYDFR